MAKVLPNWYRYLTSLASELHSQANRVRDLIGDSHWLSDGHHKEYLLQGLLERHLPAGMIAARGFSVSSQDDNLRSTEQDILIVDVSQEAPLFTQGGLVIAFPRMVRAAVSVKTTLDDATVPDTVAGLNILRNVCKDEIDTRMIWCGGYFFEVDTPPAKNPALVAGYVRKGMKDKPALKSITPREHPHPRAPDMLCSAKSLAFRIDHGHTTGESTASPARLTGYECGELATALFIAGLLDHLARCRGLADSDFGRFADVSDFKPAVGPEDLQQP